MPRSGPAEYGSFAILVVASMRPGQSCPGVASSDPQLKGSALRFNEAGAIMPRSGRPETAPPTETATGFNEAGAIMPRSG